MHQCNKNLLTFCTGRYIFISLRLLLVLNYIYCIYMGVPTFLLVSDFFMGVSQFSNTLGKLGKNIDKLESDQLQKIINECFDGMWEFTRKFEEKYSIISPDDLPLIKKNFHKLIGGWQWLMSSKISRKIYEQSFGYAGDCEVIDLIYRAIPDSTGIGYYFDEYLYNTPACQAVRNRKAFIVSSLSNEILKRNIMLKIFNLGSGPCRDIKEILDSFPESPLIIRNIDNDTRAHDYAKMVMDITIQNAHTVHFIKDNAFRIAVRDNILTYNRQDIIVSSGLFDYLKDRHAIRLIQSLWNLLADEGLMIIGNFHPQNPTRTCMEWGGNWYLVYRDKERFMNLFLRAGIPEGCIEITSEPLEINLFGIVRK